MTTTTHSLRRGKTQPLASGPNKDQYNSSILRMAKYQWLTNDSKMHLTFIHLLISVETTLEMMTRRRWRFRFISLHIHQLFDLK